MPPPASIAGGGNRRNRAARRVGYAEEGEPAALYGVPAGYDLAKTCCSKVPGENIGFPRAKLPSDPWAVPLLR